MKAPKHVNMVKQKSKLQTANKLFGDLPKEQIVWMSHGDHVTKYQQALKLIATSAACPIAAMAIHERKLYAVQFHPEVRHSVYGNDIT